MSEDHSQIETIRSQTLNLIEQIRTNPKPTYRIDGQQVLWEEYVDSLQKTVDWCDRKLLEASPYEVRSKGVG
ncbi:MAG: hypothetical protein AAGF31_01375 [Planctomycetota bacterium]